MPVVDNRFVSGLAVSTGAGRSKPRNLDHL